VGTARERAVEIEQIVACRGDQASVAREQGIEPLVFPDVRQRTQPRVHACLAAEIVVKPNTAWIEQEVLVARVLAICWQLVPHPCAPKCWREIPFSRCGRLLPAACSTTLPGAAQCRGLCRG